MSRTDYVAIGAIALSLPLTVALFVAAIQLGYRLQGLPAPPDIRGYPSWNSGPPPRSALDNADRRERLRLGLGQEAQAQEP
jgi:hypothetical protein